MQKAKLNIFLRSPKEDQTQSLGRSLKQDQTQGLGKRKFFKNNRESQVKKREEKQQLPESLLAGENLQTSSHRKSILFLSLLT